MYGQYTNALRLIDRQLARTPNDPTWIYGKGCDSLQIGANDDAVSAFTKYLEIITNNPAALLNRALANFKSDRLEAARADLLHLQASLANNFQVAFALGEIAWRQHQTNEAIRNYRVFLTNAPPNVTELNTVRERLTHLSGQ
jgi:tetratricopeptide (TPR) repeat protein